MKKIFSIWQKYITNIDFDHFKSEIIFKSWKENLNFESKFNSDAFLLFLCFLPFDETFRGK